MWENHISALKRNYNNISQSVQEVSSEIHKERFINMVDPKGVKWQRLSEEYRKRLLRSGDNPDRILRRTGNLMDSLDVKAFYRGNSLFIGVKFAQYGEYHQSLAKRYKIPRRAFTFGYTKQEAMLLANSIYSSFIRNGLWK